MATRVFSKSFIIVVTLVTAGLATACASNDSTGSSGGTSGSSGSSGTSSGSSGTSSGSSGNAGSCAGDIANCAVGTLSSAQANDMCSILAAAIDDPPGTKLECKTNGEFISVNSKADCIAKPAPKTCKVTVTQLVTCFKEAKKDACAAFATGGACAPLFDPASGCSGG